MLSPYHPIQLALGLIIWSVWFVFIYGFLSVACVLAPPSPVDGAGTWINTLLLISTLVITALLLYWARKCWRTASHNKTHDRPPQRMIIRVAAGVYAAAAIATLGVGLVVTVLPPCV